VPLGYGDIAACTLCLCFVHVTECLLTQKLLRADINWTLSIAGLERVVFSKIFLRETHPHCCQFLRLCMYDVENCLGMRAVDFSLLEKYEMIKLWVELFCTIAMLLYSYAWECKCWHLPCNFVQSYCPELLRIERLWLSDPPPCWFERRRHSIANCGRMVTDSATVTTESI